MEIKKKCLDIKTKQKDIDERKKNIPRVFILLNRIKINKPKR